jgi:hypothetical protein
MADNRYWKESEQHTTMPSTYNIQQCVTKSVPQGKQRIIHTVRFRMADNKYWKKSEQHTTMPSTYNIQQCVTTKL